MRTFLIWMLLTIAVFAVSSAAADDSLSESEAIAKIEQLGGKVIDGRPRAATVQSIPIPVAVIPYWNIVTPLILLSAYLLLSKPRSSKPNDSGASDDGKGGGS